MSSARSSPRSRSRQAARWAAKQDIYVDDDRASIGKPTTECSVECAIGDAVDLMLAENEVLMVNEK